MGIYDREYFRDERGGGIHMGPPQTIVMWLILITCGFWLANFFFKDPSFNLTHNMAASGYSLTRPWLIWQLLASGFAHADGIQHILFNMIGLWVFGRELEEIYGRYEFLRIYLTSIVLGSLCTALADILMFPSSQWIGVIGASGAISTLIVLFIMRFPHRTLLVLFVLPMPAWVFGVVFLALNVLGCGGIYVPIGESVEEAANVAYSVHLVGAAFGFLYYYFGWNLGRFVPSKLASPAKWFRRGPSLRVHDPGESEEVYADLDREGDRILAKIDREGMDSLTAKERKTLEAYSRRMRQKHR